MLTRKSGATLDDEASLVRKIFADYLTSRLGSCTRHLPGRRGHSAEATTSRQRRLRSGKAVHGRAARASCSKNRFYVGEVAYRGEVHPGEHEPDRGPGDLRPASRQSWQSESIARTAEAIAITASIDRH